MRRYLFKKGYIGRVCVKKPLLRPINKVRRLEWAKTHQAWKKEQWLRVLWSDEKKFELYNSKRRLYCRRKVGEPLRPDTVQPTVKHGGGSVMFWVVSVGYELEIYTKLLGLWNKTNTAIF
jgi:hypothetical protein